MKRLVKAIQGIGEGCALALIISGVALIGSASVILGNSIFPRPAMEVSQRLLVMSLKLFFGSSIGCLASAWTLSQMKGRVTEESRDKMWERLVEDLWKPNSKYCVASCRGCKHLMGEVRLNNYFICAQYPYGWQGSNCPDWEARDRELRG